MEHAVRETVRKPRECSVGTLQGTMPCTTSASIFYAKLAKEAHTEAVPS